MIKQRLKKSSQPNHKRLSYRRARATPTKTGICLDLIKAAPEDMPIFGVCLGHQCIGQAFGGEIVRAEKIMHGKLSHIKHGGDGVFDNLPNPLTVTRYHSLVIAPDSMPDCLDIAAQTDDGIIMAVKHKTRPVYGVQFHPASPPRMDINCSAIF